MEKSKVAKILLFLVLTLFVDSVFAFAVSSAYYENNPLYLQVGKSMDGKFILQNNAGSEDVNVKVEIIDGKNIIQLEGSTFVIPKGGRVDVPYKVVVPSGAKPADKFFITVDFTTVNIKPNNPVALGSSIRTGFTLIVATEIIEYQEKPSSKNSWYLYIIGILALIVIVFLVNKYFVNGKNRRK